MATWLVGQQFKVVGVIAGVTISALIYIFFRFRNFEWRRMCTSNADLTGKTVVITGGNSGIGKYTAIDLSRRGARVIIAGIIACRSAETAVSEIRRRSGNELVFYRQLDLSSLSSVKAFAEGFHQDETRLDILINNAGIGLGRPGEVTQEGHDIVFGTNHIGHFLLTHLLLDRLKASSKARIVNVASEGHHFASDIDMTPKKVDQYGTIYPSLGGYACSKLANILFTRELARRLKGTRVTTYSVGPGGVLTSIWKTSSSSRGWLTILYRCLYPLLWMVMLSEESGAQPIIYCAVEGAITHLSGRYFLNCHVSEESTLARDDGIAKKLWEISCEVTGIGDE